MFKHYDYHCYYQWYHLFIGLFAVIRCFVFLISRILFLYTFVCKILSLFQASRTSTNNAGIHRLSRQEMPGSCCLCWRFQPVRWWLLHLRSSELSLLLMEEILHQLIGSLSQYSQGFLHPRWCRISSINSMFPSHSWLVLFCLAWNVSILSLFSLADQQVIGRNIFQLRILRWWEHLEKTTWAIRRKETNLEERQQVVRIFAVGRVRNGKLVPRQKCTRLACQIGFRKHLCSIIIDGFSTLHGGRFLWWCSCFWSVAFSHWYPWSLCNCDIDIIATPWINYDSQTFCRSMYSYLHV